jgi:uncharacterized CHY-type Zn-finger protein
MKKYYVTYEPCTEDLGKHPVDKWVQVNDPTSQNISYLCGDLHVTDVGFEYFPLEDSHPCINKVNSGFAFGYISYINQSCDIELNPKPIPNTTLYRMKWKMFGDQYRFCIENENEKYSEMDHVDHLLLFRGIPFVSGPKYKGKLINK